jgi:hypothetical protein
MEKLVENYRTHLQHYKSRLQVQEKLLRFLGLGRLLTLVTGGYGIYLFAGNSNLNYLTGAILLLLMFVILVLASFMVRRRKELYQSLCLLNEQEIEFLINGKSSWDNGSVYLPLHHAYAADIDLFGVKSLFQHINRTVTPGGQELLAARFLAPDKEKIKENQESVSELAQKFAWRQSFLASGMSVEPGISVKHAMRSWYEAGSLNKNHIRVLSVLSWTLPVLTMASIILYWLEIIQGISLPLFFYFLNLGIIAGLLKTFRKYHKPLAGMSKSLSAYGNMLNVLKNHEFQSKRIRDLQKILKSGGTDAATAIGNLGRLLDQFDSMNNILAVSIIDGLFLYHVHGLLNFLKWKKKNENAISSWLGVLHETDMLCSLANYASNNPQNTYPIIREEAFLEIEEARHPLLKPAGCIANSLSFSECHMFILTGSNMAGKSTFLRTIGTNLLMAQMGLPVCAKRFEFYPFDLEVSMRVEDSLQEGESFFYAELKRLQAIMNHLRLGNKTLVLLDEILRGTNSNDKFKGNAGFLRQLIKANAYGILATNDLKVSGLADEMPDKLSTICFEVEVTETGLVFDYRLKNGVCSKLSASYLMEQLGIIEA